MQARALLSANAALPGLGLLPEMRIESGPHGFISRQIPLGRVSYTAVQVGAPGPSRKATAVLVSAEGNGYVQGAMHRGYEIASRRETLASAFRKLTMRGLTLIPVVDQERLVGIVTLQNMMHSMSLLAESRRLRKQVEEGQM